MTTETTFRWAFLILLMALIVMRVYFMIKVRRSGGRITPDEQAVAREGGRGVLAIRVIGFFALMALKATSCPPLARIEVYSSTSSA